MYIYIYTHVYYTYPNVGTSKSSKWVDHFSSETYAFWDPTCEDHPYIYTYICQDTVLDPLLIIPKRDIILQTLYNWGLMLHYVRIKVCKLQINIFRSFEIQPS